ncbi:hypothetical protein [Ferrimonas marina]|uniref:Uncharacterized protein n=1 Tax=Ferrimonas marina TaxID=299255 RepID=A0A1M5UAL1_9GAMM|nr:hypothetical protein [Ferrimonas marina]SHH59999.1 hypothetical protein SAMN02745129_2478 [Ferrimonas marina]
MKLTQDELTFAQLTVVHARRAKALERAKGDKAGALANLKKANEVCVPRIAEKLMVAEVDTALSEIVFAEDRWPDVVEVLRWHCQAERPMTVVDFRMVQGKVHLSLIGNMSGQQDLWRELGDRDGRIPGLSHHHRVGLPKFEQCLERLALHKITGEAAPLCREINEDVGGFDDLCSQQFLVCAHSDWAYRCGERAAEVAAEGLFAAVSPAVASEIGSNGYPPVPAHQEKRFDVAMAKYRQAYGFVKEMKGQAMQPG